jgi:RND family efflux transporter MFP subunit
MCSRRLFLVSVLAMVAFVTYPCLTAAEATEIHPGSAERPMLLAQKAPPPITSAPSSGAESVEATIINPFQSANVGSEVGGIIGAFYFEEGDLIEKGKPVAEISKKRYEILLEKSLDTVKGMKLAHIRAKQDADLKKELLASDATTRQEVLKAETDVEIAATRLDEAKKEAELTKLNLEDCVVRAPFTGYLAVKYKQPFEPVERLEKIFAIVDSSKVYAVANVAEDLLSRFPKGSTAVFEDSAGKKVTGKVAKVGKLIDPKSKTKRVYVLIDNSGGALEIGMTGSLHAGR